MTILIIGSKGYIGSKLIQYLLHLRITNMDEIDILDGKDVDSVTTKIIEKYNVIIYLAAHSSVQKCIDDPDGALVNNVLKFINFTKLLNNDQIFIYMSSASVYGNTHGKHVNEDEPLNYPHNVYDLTKQIVDEYMSKTNYNYYALRLGTVNGDSPNMRNDLMINAMVKSAQENKCINVFDKHLHRAILDINDLCKLIYTIVNSNIRMPGIYNVASFNTTVCEIGQYISSYMNVDMRIIDDGNMKSNYDFLMNTDKVRKTFNFSFQGTIKSIIDSFTITKYEPITNTCCKICNGKVEELIQFGNQSLGNVCHTIDKWPLVLDVCKMCTFIQARYMFDSTNPIPQPHDDYIDWICQYLDTNIENKSIIETSDSVISDKLCRDYGWANGKGLYVSINTIAYIQDVHSFIKRIKNIVSHHLHHDTKIILEIPFIYNLENGYYDTVYHGHNNYFNLKSIQTLLNNHKLYILDVKKTRIYDTSYLLTIGTKESTIQTNDIIPNSLELQKQYTLFKINLQEYISSYRYDGYTIVGWSSEACGNSFVNLVELDLDYIIYDSVCKKEMYIPGTTKQMYPPTRILLDVDKKIVIIPSLYNCVDRDLQFETIHKTVLDLILQTTTVTFIKLFPQIQIFYRNLHPIAQKLKTTIITHFYNEEYLLPYWLNHHKDMFDHGILIDYNSTDKSVEIIKSITPHWTIIKTDNSSFDALLCDKEVMKFEKQVKGWKLALNVTEFLCCDNLHHVIEKYQDKNNAICIRCLPMVESKMYESNVPLDIYQPLIKQRTYGVNESFRKTRTIHCAPDGQYDGRGRHYPKVFPYANPSIYDMVVLWYGYSPFNKVIIQRKLQIQNKMSEFDKINGIGKEHLTTEQRLIDQFECYQSRLVNFKELSETAHHFKHTYLC